MKTLAYFASGKDKMDFSTFNYDRIILVDNGFTTSSFSETIENNKLVIRMSCDSIKAIDILKKKKIKLDCFISINEGLFEGGGHYPLNGEYFQSYLSGILKDTYYHVYAPSYYNNSDFRTLSSRNAFRKSSFVRVSIIDFKTTGVDSTILNNAGNYDLKCFKMIRKEEETFVISENINLIYGNIWNHLEEYDHLFLPLNTHTKFLNKNNKLHWFPKGEFPFTELHFTNHKNPIKIAIIPWYSNNYKEELTELDNVAKNNNIEIALFFQDIREKEMYLI
jgi:hypothetical protein